jgi:hypothetical protein
LWLGVTAFCTALSFGSTALSAKPRQLTWDEAQQLVAAEIRSEHHDPHTGPYWDRGADDDRYLGVTVDFDTPLGMGGIVGFSVDRRTGDVWSDTNCHEYHSQALKRAQAALRRKLGIGASTYKRLRRPSPYCF